MPNNLSTNFIQEATAPETSAVLLAICVINIDDVPFLHLVNDKQSLFVGSQEYLPWAFNVSLPDQNDEGNKSCRLQIDNSDVQIYKAIKKAVTESKSITCDISIVMSTSPEYPEQGPLHFVLKNLSVNAQTISGELFDLYMSDRNFTMMKYSTEDFPGLFF